jgi:hypothetical protein
MGLLDSLFGQITNAVTNHSNDPQLSNNGYDPGPLLGAISNIFGQHAEQHGLDFSGQNVQSSDQDPYGDPGQQQFGNVQSSDADPYGDPGQQR